MARVGLFAFEGGDGMSTNLYEVRVLQKMSQYVLAQKSGIMQPRISLMENSFVVPKQEEKALLAKALKVDVNAIFPDMDSSNN